MHRFNAFVLSLALSSAGSAFASQENDRHSEQTPKAKPAQMTEAQLDNVAAGQLINVQIVDLLNDNNVEVAIPVHAAVNVAAAVGVLSSGVLARADQPVGNVTQRVRQ